MSKTMVFKKDDNFLSVGHGPATHVCSKCERTNEGGGNMLIVYTGQNGPVTKHCMWCYQDWLRANIPMMEPIKE